MRDAVGRPAGLMVLRLWTELGGAIRVRATRTTDVESSQSSTSYASTRDEVIGLVDAWLDDVTATDPQDPGGDAEV